MSYLDLPRPILILAPMEDVTDTVFRRIIQRISPFDLYMTEFTNVDGLQSPGRTATIKRLKFTPEEQPLIAQIWGAKTENYYKTTLELIEMGFVGVDINMGCPVKAVVKGGCGGGLIENPKQAIEIIQAVQSAANGKIPVSVKTRIGTKEFTPEWIQTLLEQNLAMLTVHLRTVKEQSQVPAHWELMPQIKELRDSIAPDTILIGNGDIENRAEAVEIAIKYGIDGVMIGRGVFHNPYASTIDSSWATKPVTEKLDLYRQHVELFKDTWASDRPPIAPLNKFCKTYVSGFDGAKEIREKLMKCRDLDELHAAIVSAQLSNTVK